MQDTPTLTTPRPFPGLTVTVPAATRAYVLKAQRMARQSLAEQPHVRTARIVLKATGRELARFDGRRWTDTNNSTPVRGGTA